MAAAHVAEAAGNHDRFVIAAHHAAAALRHFLFEGSKVAADVGPAELVVERGGPQRRLDHDLESRDNALGLAELPLPRLQHARYLQIRDREPGKPGLGLRAYSGRPFVADLTARASGGAGKRGDRGGMVVSLDFHQDVDRLAHAAVAHGRRIRKEARGLAARDHGGVVAVG